MAANELDEIRRLIKRCCEVADANDVAVMGALASLRALSRRIATHRRDVMARVKELQLRVGDLEREALQRRGQ